MIADPVLRVAELYASARKISLSSLGTYALRDASFFVRLAQGRVTLRRADDLLAWLSRHWPVGLDWPPDISRPRPTDPPPPVPTARPEDFPCPRCNPASKVGRRGRQAGRHAE